MISSGGDSGAPKSGSVSTRSQRTSKPPWCNSRTSSSASSGESQQSRDLAYAHESSFDAIKPVVQFFCCALLCCLITIIHGRVQRARISAVGYPTNPWLLLCFAVVLIAPDLRRVQRCNALFEEARDTRKVFRTCPDWWSAQRNDPTQFYFASIAGKGSSAERNRSGFILTT